MDTDYKKLVLEREVNIKKDITIMNLMYSINNRKNYMNYNYDVDNKEDIAQFIYDNYNKFTDDDVKYYVTKCLSIEDMRRILLEFELENRPSCQQSESMFSDEFIKNAYKILRKYQSKGGGYRLEDSEWILDNSKPDKIKFTNTIDINLVEDDEVSAFIDKMVNRLNELSVNYKVSSSYKEDTNLKLAVITICARMFIND